MQPNNFTRQRFLSENMHSLEVENPMEASLDSPPTPRIQNLKLKDEDLEEILIMESEEDFTKTPKEFSISFSTTVNEPIKTSASDFSFGSNANVCQNNSPNSLKKRRSRSDHMFSSVHGSIYGFLALKNESANINQ